MVFNIYPGKINMSLHTSADTYTAFDNSRILTSGALGSVALAVKRITAACADATVLVFDDRSGKQVDLDLRGSDADIIERHPPTPKIPITRAVAEMEAGDTQSRGRGRPKLGVVAREVTLLPRHWDWLGTQPGGASVALRKLVEQARRDNEARDRRRERQEAAYQFMSSMGGNLPGFEEATRALYADDRERFARRIAAWPEDVRGYAMQLAWDSSGEATAE